MTRVTRFDGPLPAAFLVSVAICWSPLKPLAYLAPFLFAAILLVGAGRASVLRNLSLAGAVGIAVVCLYSAGSSDFYIQNAILAAVTYSAIWIVVAMPSGLFAGLTSMPSLLAMTRTAVVIEALTGIAQAIYG